MARVCPKCFERFGDDVRRCPQHNKTTVEDLSGEIVADRYELRRLLGVGGMNSTVWMAWHSATHRNVALKLLPPTHPAAAERFARGARLASNLSHPHITIVHDYGQTPAGGLFLVMELLEGRSLHQVLKEEGAMAPERVLRMSEQVLRALDHAHRKHIVHRDLKPGNLFLLHDHGEDVDLVKVLDFGIAKAFEQDDESLDGAGEDGLHGLSSEVTHQRQVCGTPHYMAPEQVAMGRVDARTDLYSLGVVMYRMLTGRLPFEGKETHELFRMHLTEPPMLFRVARPDLEIPAAIEAVVMRALAKEPDDRFGSAAEMRVALREVRRGLGLLSEEDSFSGPPSLPGVPSARATVQPRALPSLAPPPPTVELPVLAPRGPNRLWAGLAAAGVLFGVGLWWALRANPDPPSAAVGPHAAASAATSVDGVSPAPASAPWPADVAVEVDSTPPGARVRTALRQLGETPLRVTLPRDTAALYLEIGGHAAKELKLSLGAVAPEERVKYHVTLEPMGEAPGSAVAGPAARPAGPGRPRPPDARGPAAADGTTVSATATPSAAPAVGASPAVAARPGLIDPDAPGTPAASPGPARPGRTADDGDLIDVDSQKAPARKPPAAGTAAPVELLE